MKLNVVISALIALVVSSCAEEMQRGINVVDLIEAKVASGDVFVGNSFDLAKDKERILKKKKNKKKKLSKQEKKELKEQKLKKKYFEYMQRKCHVSREFEIQEKEKYECNMFRAESLPSINSAATEFGQPVPIYPPEFDALEENNPYSENFKVRSPQICPKPRDDRYTEDRYCEATYRPKDACGCKEVCHIWGDPHVSPYFSACSTVAMTKPGNYTLYELPANENEPDRKPIRVVGTVEKVQVKTGKKKKFYKFVTALYIKYSSSFTDFANNTYTYDGSAPVLSAKMCEDYINSYFRVELPIYENTQTQDLVRLTVSAKCEYRHSDHLNVTITFRNGLTDTRENLNTLLNISQTEQINITRSADEMPPSTIMFSDDFGVCTDPLKYSVVGGGTNADVSLASYSKNGQAPFWMQSEACKRPSGLADGRDCSCSQNCAAYGDPHMHAFNENTTRGNDFFAPVKKPEYRILYSVFPFYSAIMKVDSCAFITGFYTIYMKDTLVNPQNLNDPNNFFVNEYSAALECDDPNGVHINPLTRKAIHAPEDLSRASTGRSIVDMAAYSHLHEGYNLGTFIHRQDSTAQFVPRIHQSDVASFIANEVQNQDVNPVTSVVKAGSVIAILKCHVADATNKTRDNIPGFPETTYYFNVCIERTGINVDAPPQGPDDDSRRRLKTTALINDPAAKGLLGIERVLESGGWCATGKPNWKNDKRNGEILSYEHRKVDEVRIVEYNPEDEIANQFLQFKAEQDASEAKVAAEEATKAIDEAKERENNLLALNSNLEDLQNQREGARQILNTAEELEKEAFKKFEEAQASFDAAKAANDAYDKFLEKQQELSEAVKQANEDPDDVDFQQSLTEAQNAYDQAELYAKSMSTADQATIDDLEEALKKAEEAHNESISAKENAMEEVTRLDGKVDEALRLVEKAEIEAKLAREKAEDAEKTAKIREQAAATSKLAAESITSN